VIINDIEKMLRRIIREDIDLIFIPASNLGFVKADPDQIEQVTMNLAANARDAMPRGGKLTIETSNLELDESYVK
jgi:signal transduction histidine kinase